ncbi:hypothetical protein RHMOL_Rhmol08G0095600 [Rhododendron molle]|uniref:Uncharacterized protein n=1 Tax=Rhododendron molle TaxID=49168 RepID=A0ACC0MMT1_RHOML|nr:hypothetical protein RHMOL_Rhmol08G0095600 [Rhododendron molle]
MLSNFHPLIGSLASSSSSIVHASSESVLTHRSQFEVGFLCTGLGCSSIGGGAFTELGPFYPKGDDRGLRRNSMSWNRAFNLLFVESPAGVGWSYSNTTSDYDCGDDSTARDMFTFMLKWYEKFPEFKSRDLFLTRESYAGKKVE